MPAPSSPESPLAPWLNTGTTLGLVAWNVLVGLGYFALAQLVHLPPFGDDDRVALVWPAAGLALAAVHRFGAAVMPGIAIGWSASTLIYLPAPFAAASSIAQVLGALAGEAAMRRVVADDRLTRVRAALALTFVVASVAALASASIGSLAAFVFGPVSSPAPTWSSWLMRHWLGVATVTPLLLTWQGGWTPPIAHGRWLEAVALVGSLPLVSWLLQAADIPGALVAVPYVSWAGLRLGAWSAALAASMAALAFGTGPAVLMTSALAALPTFAVLLAASAIGLVLAAVTSERDRALQRRAEIEEQLRHTQKIEAVGRLAGGIAHDFNNLLTAIIGYADIVIASLDRSDPRRADAEEIERAAMRAADLTRRMLSFSRREAHPPRVIDLNTTLTKAEPLLRRIVGEDISLTIAPKATRATVRLDTGQMEQVIMNLAVNARDAMPRGGRLTVETTDVTLDEETTAEIPGAEGDYVSLSVTDTGTGIPPSIRGRIFEPYFTSKEAGRGTGLGLSTVYGIVRQSDGHITFTTEVGAGTTFRVLLPRAEAEPAVEAEPGQPRLPGGSEHVLLVEDDISVRRVTKELLVRLGYSVTEAASGRAGIALASDDSRHFDVALCDVILGDMSGPALAEALQALLPEVRVLYMSGYTDEAIVRTGVLDEGKPFLQKPFTPMQLARKVREVLEGIAQMEHR